MHSTQELKWIPVQRVHKEALQQGKAALQALLGVSVPDGWPEFPEAFAVDGPSPPDEWPSVFFIDPARQALVGNGGFAGPPGEDGEVEIGYEIAPPYRNQGYATAAVRALVATAFGRPGIEAVVAHTLAQENASNRVLRKVGMALVAELPNPEVGQVWKWRLGRPA